MKICPVCKKEVRKYMGGYAHVLIQPTGVQVPVHKDCVVLNENVYYREGKGWVIREDDLSR